MSWVRFRAIVRPVIPPHRRVPVLLSSDTQMPFPRSSLEATPLPHSPPAQAALSASISSPPEDPDEEALRACLAIDEEDLGYGPAAAAAAAEAAAMCGYGASRSSRSTGRKPGGQDEDKAKDDEGGQDIIGTMIDVFGSVDVFIQEYRWAVRGGVHV